MELKRKINIGHAISILLVCIVYASGGHGDWSVLITFFLLFLWQCVLFIYLIINKSLLEKKNI